MLRKTKKGQGLVEIFSWIMAVFFTVLFFVLMNLPSCSGPPEQKIISASLTDLKVNSDLSAFVRGQVTYQETELSVADLIVLSFENESMKNDLGYFIPTLIPQVDLVRVIEAMDDRAVKSRDYPLSLAANTMMKSYNEYIPSASSKHLFCSFRVYAKRGGDEISLYDTRFNWYDKTTCGFEYMVAETKIPDFNGEPIDIKLVATVDKAKLAALGIVSVNSPAAGILLASYLDII